MDFSETIAASDLKVSRTRHLIEHMKICEYWRSGYFLTLAQGRVHIKIWTGFSQKVPCRSEPNFLWKLSGTRKWKSDDMILVTWPRWPPRPYMVKTSQKYFSPNRWAEFNLTWYVALGTPAHLSLFKLRPWPDFWPILRQGQIFQVLYVLCFTWTRYQVSVYRTIGPLVLKWFGIES